MYGYSEIKSLATEMYVSAKKGCESVLKQESEKAKQLQTLSFDESVNVVKELMLSVETAIKGISNDLRGNVPKFLSSFTALESNGKLSGIRMNIKTKLKVDFPCKHVDTILVNDRFLENFVDFYINAILQIYYVELAGENIKELNEYLFDVYEKENIKVHAFFVLNGVAEVPFINDSEVWFSLTTEQAHRINTLSIFDSGDAYADRCATLAYDEFVKEMKSVQITPQIVKARVSLINTLMNMSSKKRVDSILRVGLRKADKFIPGEKGFGKGYLSKKMVVDGVETTVFTIIENSKEGLNVVLRPFDVKTMLYVDVTPEQMLAIKD